MSAVRATLPRILALSLLSACSGVPFTGAVSSEPVDGALALNLPVLVNAGADRDVLRGYPTTLRGMGTTHPLHRAFAVTWQQLAGDPVFLSNDSSLCPTFTPPLAEQDLVFRLTATDGIYSTWDDVVLRVKSEPQYSAPRVAAVADRFLAYDEAASPEDKDIATELGTDVTPSWEEVLPVRLDNAPASDSDAVTPRVFRLSATRYGLSSEPDYLVLYPFDSSDITNLAPSASLTGPSLVAPGASIDLDAGASSDPNGDSIRLRWEETGGEPGCLEAGGMPKLSLSAPRGPQELTYRVFASDGVLESAPADLQIVVSADPDFLIPAVQPGPDQRTRPTYTVRLDALGGAPRGTQPCSTCTYRWTQSLGPSVELPTESQGRAALFTAPATFDTLAFSVFGSADGVDGPPAVVAVTVVKDEDNLPPTLYVSASDSTPAADTWVTVTARIIDPEGDPIASVGWLQTDGPTVSLIPVTDSDPLTSGEAQVKFQAPVGPTPVVIEISVCDDRDDCSNASVSVTPD